MNQRRHLDRRHLSDRVRDLGRVNSARYFIRREDDEPRRTPPDSPFRKFDAKCLKCGSYQLRVAAEFDEEAGETRLILFCKKCRQQEQVGAR